MQGVLGDAEIPGHLVPGLGDEEGPVLAEELDGLDLVLLVHDGGGLAHQGHGLLDQLVQQVADVGDALRLGRNLLPGGGQVVEGLLHEDEVVDGQDGGNLPLPVPDIHGGGFQNLAVRRLGQVAQVVLGLRVLGAQLLHHHVGRAVPHLPPRHVAVGDEDDGAVRIAAEIVNGHLAVGTELGGNAGGHLTQELQLAVFRG